MSLTTPNQPDHLLLKKRRKSARPGVTLEDYVPGLEYSPYLPMTSSDAKMDPGFEPRKLIKSRYAIKQVNNKFYGVINVNGRKTNPRYLLLLK